jgi:alpha-L-fucosidase 2
MRFNFLFVTLSFAVFQNNIHAQSSLKLWYNKPATQWVEASSLGNGHIDAMVFGALDEELIQLNESTLYSGGPVKKNINSEAYTYLPQIREALLKDGLYKS